MSKLARWAACLLLLLPVLPALGYSVLTHEQIIDLTWRSSFVPLLRARFPQISEAELHAAHAYAYGGSAIQDNGYYPFGHEFFSDLTHYVRTADFVAALLREAKTPNELAFAAGALSHFIGDSIGHRDAINVSTAIEFSKVGDKYGPVVTYEENPRAHVRTEFAFDINQLSKDQLAPSKFMEQMGFKVPHRLLERAFLVTYGLSLHNVLGQEPPAIRSYRWSVRHFLPAIARSEAVIYHAEFPPEPDSDDFRSYQADMMATSKAFGWQPLRRKPGFRTHLLAWVIRVLPKVGVLSDLSIRGPQVQTEDYYLRSVNRTRAQLARELEGFTRDPHHQLNQHNHDLDTGDDIVPGNYKLADEAYSTLLHRLTKQPKAVLPLELKENLLAFYINPRSHRIADRNPKLWAQVVHDLPILERMPAVTAYEIEQGAERIDGIETAAERSAESND